MGPRHGFVYNEPFIVFGILCVVCLILAGLLPFAWYWQILLGIASAVAVAALAVSYVGWSEKVRKRRPRGPEAPCSRP